MSRKRFNPFVLLEWVPTPPPEETEVPGIDTGTGHVDPPGGDGGNSVLGPLSFQDWSSQYGVDYDESGAVDMNDYIQWWTSNGFDMDAWNMANPGVAFGVAAAETDVIPGE